MFTRMVFAVVIFALGADLSLVAAVPKEAHHPRHVLGATHAGGKYSLTNDPYLVEGARQISSLGFRVIKLYIYPPPASNSSDRTYPFHSRWPTMKTPVDVARTTYFRQVLRMPFEAIILTVYSGGRPAHYWRHGINDEQVADETRQFRELTRHLMTTYQGTRKTFILSHWEGDWAARGSFDACCDITPLAMKGMIGWLKARQAGVNVARNERTPSDVRVFHAAEVNRVRDAMDRGRTCVVDLPEHDIRATPFVSSRESLAYASFDDSLIEFVLRFTKFAKVDVFLAECFGIGRMPCNEVQGAAQQSRIVLRVPCRRRHEIDFRVWYDAVDNCGCRR